MTRLNFVTHLRELVASVDVVLSDIWGVIHNGVESFPAACDALRCYRSEGGTVILITNAPRLADSVRAQVRDLGVGDDCYDAIVSSGDLTRNYVAAHPGRPLFWLGPNRDASIYRDLDAPFVALEQADYMICTGLYDDDTETAEDYRAMMEQARARSLPMVCANPDIVVQRGDQLIDCAGAIAELYSELGGEVIYYGKPYAPIYQRALELAAECRGQPIALNRALAIGDSLRTDIAGARGYGIDCVFITRGIHAGEFDGPDARDPALKPLFDAPPKAVMRDLAW
ncbi:MAG: TIGR01459 family HAD-type hydrolase [Alphaproteobacteria bacterium]|nr:TIGR01459 family HAD-type hydrolase [Alphaproteobacteria bacterium]